MKFFDVNSIPTKATRPEEKLYAIFRNLRSKSTHFCKNHMPISKPRFPDPLHTRQQSLGIVGEVVLALLKKFFRKAPSPPPVVVCMGVLHFGKGGFFSTVNASDPS